MLAIYFSGSYAELPQLFAVLNYEWRTYPEVRVNFFKGDRETNIRRFISNIYKRKPTLQESTVSVTGSGATYKAVRKSLLDKVR